MTQTDLGTIDGTPVTGTSGSALAVALNGWHDSVHSGHLGVARPPYAVTGMTWVKQVSGTAHEVYYFDGADDILLYTINPATNYMDLTRPYNLFGNSGNTVLNPTGSPVDGFSYSGVNKQLILSNTANNALAIVRHGSNGVVAQWYRNNAIVGSISVTTTATTYATSSDYRLKYDVEPIATYSIGELDGPLGKLMKLRPVKYYMHADDGAEKHYGFIAHELQEHVPHAVTGHKDECEERQVADENGNTSLQWVPVYQGVDYGQVMSLAVAAIQQLTARVIELEARLAEKD